MKCRPWLKKTAITGLALVALVLAAFLFPNQILTLDSGAVKADVLIVLGGGWTERPERAAELFKAGEASLIICTGDGDAYFHETYLTNHGVPVADILVEPKSNNTRENAEFTIDMLHERHLKSAIIVTSWYHSRRALACFEHYAPDIKFYSRPTYYAYARSQWKQHRIKLWIKAEYFKTLGYWVFYGICPVFLRLH